MTAPTPLPRSTVVSFDDVNMRRLELIARRDGMSVAEVARERVERSLRSAGEVNHRELTVELNNADLALLDDIARATGSTPAALVAKVVHRVLDQRRQTPTTAPGGAST